MKTMDVKMSSVNPAVRIALPVLGLIGAGIAGYLTYIHYQNLNSICLFNAKCDTVLTSEYSAMWGVPLSLFGLLMYLALVVLSLGSLWAKEEWRNWLAVGIYGIALSAVLFTIYLYYLEIFEIHAFCSWCIASSIVVLAIFVLSLFNLPREKPGPKEKGRRRRFKLSDYVRW